jgi:Tfp pilus assembly protein PilF
MGMTYMALGEYKKAVGVLETAVEKAPNAVPIYIDLAKSYKMLHENNKAYEIFKKAAAMTEDPKLKKEAEAEAEKVWNR